MALSMNLFDAAGNRIPDFGWASLLRMTTKLPGGNFQVVVAINASFTDRWEEINAQIGQVATVNVYDESTDLIWSGRRGPATLQAGESTLVANGWYISLWDQLYSSKIGGYIAGVPGGASVYPHQVIQEMLSTTLPLLSTDQSLISTANNTPVNMPPDGSQAYVNRYAGDIVNDLLKIPDQSGNPFYVAVGADKRLTYAKQPTAPTWYTTLDDLAPGWGFVTDPGTVYSSVVIEMSCQQTDPQTGNTIVRRVTSQLYVDTSTQAVLGYDKQYYLRLPDTLFFVPASIGGVVNDEPALLAIAKQFLKTHNRAKQRTQQFVIGSGYVQDAGGNFVPSWRVQAGDVIQIRDLPVSSDTYDGSLDDRRTFFVVATDYDAERRQCVITPDMAPDDFALMMARLAGQIGTSY